MKFEIGDTVSCTTDGVKIEGKVTDIRGNVYFKIGNIAIPFPADVTVINKGNPEPPEGTIIMGVVETDEYPYIRQIGHSGYWMRADRTDSHLYLWSQFKSSRIIGGLYA